MAELRELNGTRVSHLEAEHLIGRGPQCALQLSGGYVSAQHAVLRWAGECWELIDRGSRNGTHLDGQLVAAGRPYPVKRGAVLTFGDPRESWTLSDAGEPEVSLIDLESGAVLSGLDGVIGVPSNEDPVCTVFRDRDGQWKVEHTDQLPAVLRDGQSFTVAGRRFRLSCPGALGSTATTDFAAEPAPPTLVFKVSLDEEFVELFVEYATRVISLGARSHNYLLLLLARARLANETSELLESARGWVYKEQLGDDLRMTPQQIDGEVFRIRKHFAQNQIEGGATIIERRPRTRQLRLGLARVKISKI